MPIKKYNRYFGGNANKALKSMIAEYGPEKGRRVFYATVNKLRRKKGKKAGGLSRQMGKQS